MERLTKDDLNKVCYDPWEICGMDKHCTKGCHEEGGCTGGCHILKMHMKLAEYEDAEENGMLIHLPCKVGDTVYALTPFCEICEEALDNEYACENCSRGNFITETKFGYEMIPMVGKRIFLTEAEAEQALAKMGE